MLCVSQAVCAQGLDIESGQEFYNKCLFKPNNDTIKTYVDEYNRFRMDVRKNLRMFRNGFEYNIDEDKNYSISAKVYKFDNNSDKKETACCGIIFGYKDDNNFALFLVNSSQYNIIVKKDGVRAYELGWEWYKPFTYGNIYKYNRGRKLDIIRKWDKIFFAVDEKIVKNMDVFPLSGNMHGFYVDGKGKYGIDRFKIEEGEEAAIASSQSRNES